MKGLLYVESPVAFEAADHFRQGDYGWVVIKTKPFNSVKSIHCVCKSDELNSNQSVVSASIVDVTLSFLAATDKGGEKRAGAELHYVAVVEE